MTTSYGTTFSTFKHTKSCHTQASGCGVQSRNIYYKWHNNIHRPNSFHVLFFSFTQYKIFNFVILFHKLQTWNPEFWINKKS